MSLRSHPWSVSAATIDAILPFSRSGYSVPLHRSPTAPSPSASPRRDRDLAPGVPGLEFPSCGATIQLSVGLAVLASHRPPHVPRSPSGREITELRCSERACRISLVRVRALMSPASSPTSPRRAGTVPWIPWRPPYAIMSSAYGNRRPASFEVAPNNACWQSNLLLRLMSKL